MPSVAAPTALRAALILAAVADAVSHAPSWGGAATELRHAEGAVVAASGAVAPLLPGAGRHSRGALSRSEPPPARGGDWRAAHIGSFVAKREEAPTAPIEQKRNDPGAPAKVETDNKVEFAPVSKTKTNLTVMLSEGIVGGDFPIDLQGSGVWVFRGPRTLPLDTGLTVEALRRMTVYVFAREDERGSPRYSCGLPGALGNEWKDEDRGPQLEVAPTQAIQRAAEVADKPPRELGAAGMAEEATRMANGKAKNAAAKAEAERPSPGEYATKMWSKTLEEGQVASWQVEKRPCVLGLAVVARPTNIVGGKGV